ncbi:MAG: hypothetical protein AB7O26_09065 [Planctomycetaceae bacterium]
MKPMKNLKHSIISGRSGVLALLLGVSCLAIGCGDSGPERVSVSGKVQIDNQPLKSGRIIFIPQEPTVGPAASAHIVDGVYQISDVDGAVVGSNRVEIKADMDLGFPLDDDEAFAKLEGAPLPPNPVPVKYNQRSELNVETSSDGPNEFDFTLMSDMPANSAQIENH